MNECGKAKKVIDREHFLLLSFFFKSFIGQKMWRWARQKKKRKRKKIKRCFNREENVSHILSSFYCWEEIPLHIFPMRGVAEPATLFLPIDTLITVSDVEEAGKKRQTLS